MRGSAIFLFGDIINSGGRKFQQRLKNLAIQALVPLLFHLADCCQEVVMVSRLPRPGGQGRPGCGRTQTCEWKPEPG